MRCGASAERRAFDDVDAALAFELHRAESPPPGAGAHGEPGLGAEEHLPGLAVLTEPVGTQREVASLLRTQLRPWRRSRAASTRSSRMARRPCATVVRRCEGMSGLVLDPVFTDMALDIGHSSGGGERVHSICIRLS